MYCLKSLLVSNPIKKRDIQVEIYHKTVGTDILKVEFLRGQNFSSKICGQEEVQQSH